MRTKNKKHPYLSLYRQMLPHWSVNKFLEEIENLFGCVFIFGKNYEVEIISRVNYYKRAENIYLKKVLEKSLVVEPNDTEESDVSTSTIRYKFQSNDINDYFDETLKGYAEKVIDNDPLGYLESIDDPLRHGTIVEKYDGTQWIAIGGRDNKELSVIEMNQLRDLDRGEEVSEIGLEICPARYVNTWIQIDRETGQTPGQYVIKCPESASFKIETGTIDIEKYISPEEQYKYETGEENGVIVMALWEGIDSNPIADGNIPYFMGWSHGYNRDLGNKIPEMRTKALRIVDIHGMITLGNAFYNEGQQETPQVKIDTSIKYTIEFADEIPLMDLRKPFVYGGHRYVAHNIERKVNKKGFEIIKKGEFYRMY